MSQDARGVTARITSGISRVLIVGVVMTFSLVAPSSAHAELSQDVVGPPELLACSLSVGTPFKFTQSGSTFIRTVGSREGCSGTRVLRLQRDRWFGWEAVASAVLPEPSFNVTATYNCTGDGTFTYRGAIYEGTAAVVVSSHFRTSC